MTPVEAAARALATQYLERKPNIDLTPDSIVTVTRNEHGPYWMIFVADARAALAAIRTPTEGMIEAIGTVLVRSGEKRSNAPVMAPVIWQAAIDAAMEETDG